MLIKNTSGIVVYMGVYLLNGGFQHGNIYSGLVHWKAPLGADNIDGMVYFLHQHGDFKVVTKREGPIYDLFKFISFQGRNLSEKKQLWPLTIVNFWEAYSNNYKEETSNAVN